jgi:hypothetical protein
MLAIDANCHGLSRTAVPFAELTERCSVAHADPPFALIHDIVTGNAHKASLSDRLQLLECGVAVFDR